MDSTLIQVIFVTIQLCLVMKSYSIGTPIESCDTLLLNSTYHERVEQTSRVPFEIDTSVFQNPYSDDLFYSPNSSFWSKSFSVQFLNYR